MIGEKNSVFPRLKKDSPHSALILCSCYSLTIQHALDKMPRGMGFLLNEIPKHFCKSTVWPKGFIDCFKKMNP